MTTQWEYKVLTVEREGTFKVSNTPTDEQLTTLLNREGTQGWELVNAVLAHYAQPVTLYLKRPR